MTIHPSAIIAAGVELDPTVSVGPFSVIEDGVTIGEGTKVGSHSRITGPTRIGKNNTIDSFVTLGGAPQDLGYKEGDTELVIGDNNLIREYASIHRGTVKGGGTTRIGNNNMIMAYAHLGHDCQIGNHVIIVNTVQLSGHTEVDDHATIGGMTGIHQFTRIGTFSFIGALSAVSKDVPPFAMVSGERGHMSISGLNKIGLRRNGFSRETISKIDAAYRIIFHSELLHNEALDKTEQELGSCRAVAELVRFIRESKRGVVRRIKRN